MTLFYLSFISDKLPFLFSSLQADKALRGMDGKHYDRHCSLPLQVRYAHPNTKQLKLQQRTPVSPFDLPCGLSLTLLLACDSLPRRSLFYCHLQPEFPFIRFTARL